MRLTRRTMMQGTILSASVAGAGPALARARRGRNVAAPLRWIDGAAPGMHNGQTFGVAWPRQRSWYGTSGTGSKRQPSLFTVKPSEVM